MTYQEISKLLKIDGKEVKIFMPNEIFDDLQNQMKDATHIAYAYSYMYLIHFLYRNCKYFNIPTVLNGDVIKEILGYKKSNRTMNYITIKDEGLLDQMGYTKSTKDYPMSWTLEDKELSFFNSSDVDEYTKHLFPTVPKKFFLKYPIKGMDNRIIDRVIEGGEIEEIEMLGTFFDIDNTHEIDFNVFMFCMSKKKLGVVAFYLYSWLKYKNDWHDAGYDVPLTKLSDETGIPRRTMIQYMDLLKGYKMVDFQHNQSFFVVGAYKEDRKATTYYANGFDMFKSELQTFNKMSVMEREEYLTLKKQEAEAIVPKDKIEMEVSLLPY